MLFIFERVPVSPVFDAWEANNLTVFLRSDFVGRQTGSAPLAHETAASCR